MALNLRIKCNWEGLQTFCGFAYHVSHIYFAGAILR